MNRYSVSKRFDWAGRLTEKSTSVMRMFGLTVEGLSERGVVHSCQLEVDEGDVVYITGPSGSGKSVLLRELEKAVDAGERINLAEIELPADKTLVDCVEGDFLHSLKILSTAGLNDCLCLLNSPAYLSDGQKYRFRLAMAISSGSKFIFADEFCSGLDRVTAAVVSYNIQKYAKQAGVIFMLAGSGDGLLVDLAADVLVVKELAGRADVIYKDKKR